MENDKELVDEALKEGVLYAYCPRHLSVERRDELWVFPLNILFSKFRNESDGSLTMGSAVYEPDLSTLRQNGPVWSMSYRNLYGGDSYVVITLNTVELSYRGEKFVNGVSVGFAVGAVKNDADKGWQVFFFHLTMLGLTNGEQCKFEPTK